jgi:hypothetical protein
MKTLIKKTNNNEESIINGQCLDLLVGQTCSYPKNITKKIVEQYKDKTQNKKEENS